MNELGACTHRNKYRHLITYLDSKVFLLASGLRDIRGSIYLLATNDGLVFTNEVSGASPLDLRFFNTQLLLIPP